MKKSRLIRLAILLLTTSALSGCLLIPVDDGHRNGGPFEGDGGGHHRDNGEHRGNDRGRH